MKKNIILLVLMFVLCVGLFMPCSVFARENRIYNNIGINYRFSVQDENGNDVKDLKFRLYDKTGSLSFESEYDEDKNEYVFNENEFFYKSAICLVDLPIVRLITVLFLSSFFSFSLLLTKIISFNFDKYISLSSVFISAVLNEKVGIFL